MFKKLLKYDFKAIFSIWWIGAISILVLAIPTGITARNLVISNYTSYGEMFNALWIYVYYFLAVAFTFLSTVLVFIRYYSNFFKDEAYLTFTLPVKRSTLYLSKLTSAFLINLMTALTEMVALFIILTITPVSKGKSTPVLFDLVSELFELFLEAFQRYGVPIVILNILGIIAGIVLYSVLSVSLIYLFISIGSTVVKKHKILVTIGIIYLSSFVASFILIPLFILIVMWSASASAITTFGFFSVPALLIILLLLVALMTVITLISLVNMGILERKLNLQ